MTPVTVLIRTDLVRMPLYARGMSETFVLVPGMWLGGWAWSSVAERLRADGHRAVPVTLTGVGDRVAEDGPSVDLETHVADIVVAVEAQPGPVVLVGHSYGGLPVTAAAARLGGRVRRVVYVDSGPLPDGTRQLDMGAPVPADVPVPPRPWDRAADPVMLAGLDDDAIALLEKRSTTHPYGSVAQPLRRGGEVTAPVALIACLFSPEQIAELRAQGHPFFAGLGDATIHSLPTGHWPMLSEPARLAALLAADARA